MKRFLLAAGLALLALSAGAQVRVVGHRGARFNTPSAPETPYYENTLASLQFAQTLGIYAAEFDVQVTSDNRIIVFHGPTVPGLGKSIHSITFDEARKVVLPGGHQMPTLEEYLAQARKNPAMKVICEIKKQSTPARETLAAEQVVATVRKMKMEDQVEYTTFSDWCVQELHRIDPKAKVIFIEGGVNIHDPDYCKSRGYDAVSFDINGFMNHPGYAKRAKELGLETTLWIVNDYEVVDWAIRHGIDFVSSDHPERIVEYLQGTKSFEKR